MKEIGLLIKYIKLYMSRSMSIIISIVISVALIIGIGTLSKSAKQAEIIETKYKQGSYHTQYRYLNKTQLDIINKNKNIKKIGLASYYDTYITTDGLKLFLINADEKYVNLDSLNNKDMVVKKGRYPSKKGEIALEEWVIEILGIEGKTGQKIKLNLNDSGKTEAFTLSGILNDRPSQKMTLTPQAFLHLEKNTVNESDKITASIEFKNNIKIEENIKSISKKANIKPSDINRNSHLLSALNEKKKLDYKVITMSVIVFIISFIVVYGIFNISILKRTTDYGIFRAIGGSIIQIWLIILVELFILSIISIPIGFLMGLIGASLFSSISGGVFTESVVEIQKLTITLDIFILSVIIILLNILLISTITTINIRNISPVDAIRKNIRSKKLITKQLISVKTLNRFLSFPNILTIKNLLRDKKNFYTIVISMSIGGVMFVMASFYSYLNIDQSKKIAEINGFDSDYKINMVPGAEKRAGISKEDIKNIKELDGVQSLTSSKVLYSRLMLSDNNITEPMYFEQINSYPYINELMNGMLVKNESYKNINDKYILKNITYGYDDELLKKLNKYISKGEININDMRNKNIAVVRIPHPTNSNKQSPYVVDMKIGDTIKVAFKNNGTNTEQAWQQNYNDNNYIIKEFIVGGIVDELIDYDNYYTVRNSVDIVISSEKFEDITGFRNYRAISINKKPKVDNRILGKEISKIADKTTGAVVRNLGAEIERHSVLEKNKLTFIYSIIVMIFTISLFNIINKINYSLVSRTSEFGILRAIGVTNNTLKKMIIFEGMVYGIVTSISVLIFGVIGQSILFKLIRAKLISPKFFIRWQDYLVILVINICISFISTYLVSIRINKLSIVKSIEYVS